jgi:hypothetical protein
MALVTLFFSQIALYWRLLGRFLCHLKSQERIKVCLKTLGPDHAHVVVTLNGLTYRARACRTASECRSVAEEPAAFLGDG